MRLTSFLILVSALQVAAASSSGQTVTYAARSESLESVFKAVEKQTGYLFFYDRSLLSASEPVSVSAVKAPLDKFLQEIFASQPLSYFIEKTTIFVVKKPDIVVAMDVLVNQPPVTVSGTLVHSESKAPLEGASIYVKSTRYLGSTDVEGHFSVPSKIGDVLTISYVGFKSREVKVTAVNMGIVTLSPAEVVLNELVINKGYYSTSRRLNTGSVSKVTSEDIERQPVTSPILALQGRVPGLEISPSAGVPGAFVSLRVRGINSLRYDANAPLYIIDGVPVDARAIVGSSTSMTPQGFDPLSTINPANIESIEVLKDADATAIYGSRGANGIILITTKQFSRGGKTNVDLSASSGVGKVGHKVKLLNTQQFLEMRREAFRNDNELPGNFFGDYDLTKWDTTRYTDWQEVLLGNTVRITDAQGAVSGGTGGTTFRLESGYHKETSILSQQLGYKRGSVSASLTHGAPNQRLHTSVTINYGIESNDMVSFTNYGNLADIALHLAPNAPRLYTDDGELNWENNTFENPLASLRATYHTQRTTLMSNAGISYKLLPGLVIKTSLGYTELHNSDLSKVPLSSINPYYQHYYTGSMGTATEKRTSYIIEPTASYTNAIGAGDLNVVIGATWQDNRAQSLSMFGSGYTTDALIGNLRAATSVFVERDITSQYRYNAVFGRIGYNIREKYLLNLTGRRDGSSRFGTGNRFASFGAVGLGWIFTKEPGIAKALPFLSFGKLRGSYGSTGNDQIGDYHYLSTYSVAPYPYANTTGFYPTALQNPKFAWELTRKLELALETGFLKDAITLEAMWYRNRSSNQLVGYSLPATTGFPDVTANFPATVQNSGFEVMLQTQNISHAHFKWSSSFNIAVQRNKLIAFPGLEESSYYQLKRGRPLTILRLFHINGVNPATGLYEFEDVNKDGFITYDEDATEIRDPSRNYYGGLNNSFSFRNVEISFLIQFIKQPGFALITSYPGNNNNQPVEVLDRWQKPGDIALYQRFAQSFYNSQFIDIVNKIQQSSRILTDASFARLKTMTVSWSLPQKWMKEAHMNGAKLYIQGQNLLTFTSYKSLDPESAAAFPPVRMILGGLQLKF